jgi:hypothetical protein
MIGRYGGDLAGPVFRRVAEASLRYLGVTPTGTPKKIASVKREGDPADILMAAMKPGASASASAAPPEAPPAGPVPAGSVRVPELSGMGAHEAVVMLNKAGLLPQIEGTGRLVRQQPSPGTPVPKGSAVRLVFEPAS